MIENENIQLYWQQYLATLLDDSTKRDEVFTAESWGDSAQMADELGALIMAGTKTATCSALWEWEAEGETLPEVGLKTIVLNGREQPLCISEITEVKIRPFNQVGAQFAYEEGEGDRSLTYWREVHWRFFTRTLAAIGRQPTAEMPLVCEHFQTIYV
jgi:uncharacterized protein YhfF